MRCCDWVLVSFLEAVAKTALGSRQFIIVVVTVVITLPLSLYRDVAKISKVSDVLTFLSPSSLEMTIYRILRGSYYYRILCHSTVDDGYHCLPRVLIGIYMNWKCWGNFSWWQRKIIPVHYLHFPCGRNRCWLWKVVCPLCSGRKLLYHIVTCVCWIPSWYSNCCSCFCIRPTYNDGRWIQWCNNVNLKILIYAKAVQI